VRSQSASALLLVGLRTDNHRRHLVLIENAGGNERIPTALHQLAAALGILAQLGGRLGNPRDQAGVMVVEVNQFGGDFMGGLSCGRPAFQIGMPQRQRCQTTFKRLPFVRGQVRAGARGAAKLIHSARLTLFIASLP
jgi:hypothetical protein